MFDIYDFTVRDDMRRAKILANRRLHRLQSRRFLRVCPKNIRMSMNSNSPFIYYGSANK